MPTTAIDLEELLETARQRADAEAAKAAERARRDDANNLHADRKAAVSWVRDVLETTTVEAAWERLETPEDGIVDRAVVHPLGDDLALAFRQRGVTQGGPVLVVMAPAGDGSLVGSAREVGRLADLPAAVDDARRRAEEWTAILERADEAHDGDVTAALEADETRRPAIRIEGDSTAELLEELIGIIARGANGNA